MNIIIGGVYCRSRPSSELEMEEFSPLSDQVLKASSYARSVLVMRDMNIDQTNPYHKKAKEAKDLLSIFEASNMRRLPCTTPTWKIYGLHKTCPCPTKPDCNSGHEGKKPFNYGIARTHLLKFVN